MLALIGPGAGAIDPGPCCELDSGTDQGREFGGCEPQPVTLGGLDEFERHADSRGPGTGSPGRTGLHSDGRERRLDRVGGPQMDPVAGRVIVERQQVLSRSNRFVNSVTSAPWRTSPSLLEAGVHTDSGTVAYKAAVSAGRVNPTE